MLTKPNYGVSDRYIGREGEEYFAWQNSLAHVGGRIEAGKFAPYIQPSDCVLDFGCGGGYTLKYLHCARRLGVEINPAARGIATQNGIEVYASVAEIENATVDVLISNHAIEHVPYPIEAIRALRTKLKPGGSFVLVLPLDDWRNQRRYLATDINHHLHTWTPQLLGNTLAEAGFDPNLFEIHILTHAWFPGAHKVFSKVPNKMFDVLCALFSMMVRRRQLVARNVKQAGVNE
jgi:SAM-dependent methyltransferase